MTLNTDPCSAKLSMLIPYNSSDNTRNADIISPIRVANNTRSDV